MALKDLAVPALCILGTLYFIKGCENGKRCDSYHPHTSPQPKCRVYQKPVQEEKQDYEGYEGYETPVYQQTIIRRQRVIRRTIVTPVYQNDYGNY